jgi:hypothetical protein
VGVKTGIEEGDGNPPASQFVGRFEPEGGGQYLYVLLGEVRKSGSELVMDPRVA